MSVLKIKDENNQWIAIQTIQGPKGDKGDPYTLTDADKQAIINSVIAALPVYEGGIR